MDKVIKLLMILRGLDFGENEADETAEEESVEICHDEKAKDDGDDAEEFDAIEATDAIGEAVGDFLVEDDNGEAATDHKYA